jgi:NADH:ubiquinone reductase (H+-translocating)
LLPRDDSERQRLLTFVIIGGGPTGVEMAGAIAEVARQTLARDFRRIDSRTARIVLIEAGPRLLPTFSEQHSSYARDTLVAMGVDVMTSSPVLECDGCGVASAAKQMGKYVGKLIAARVAGQSLPPFHYRHEGSLATIGRRAAVVELGPIQLRGFIGWMFWSAVHIYFLIGIRNGFVVAVTWLWSYVTFTPLPQTRTECCDGYGSRPLRA